MSSLQSINIPSASDNTSSGFFEIENSPVLNTVTILSGSLQNYDSINLMTVPKLKPQLLEVILPYRIAVSLFVVRLYTIIWYVRRNRYPQVHFLVIGDSSFELTEEVTVHDFPESMDVLSAQIGLHLYSRSYMIGMHQYL